MISDNQTLILIVLIASFSSALWHSLVKGSSDKILFNSHITVTQLVCCTPLLPFIALPNSEIWMYLIAAAALHAIYDFYVAKSYMFGEIGYIFPLARGLAPILILLLEYCLFHASVPTHDLWGILLVSIGVMGFTLFEPKFFQRHLRLSASYALITALIISIFSIVDAKGIRLSITPWTFIIWLFFLKGIFNTIVMLIVTKGDLKVIKINNYQCVMAGLIAFLSYGAILWCFTYQITAFVVSLRVSAVVFAMFLGFLVNKEAVKPYRIIASCIIILGIIVLSFVQT